MGFWDSFGKVAGGAVGAMIDEANKKKVNLENYYETNSSKTDKQVITRFKNSWISTDEKVACRKIIQERGIQHLL